MRRLRVASSTKFYLYEVSIYDVSTPHRLERLVALSNAVSASRRNPLVKWDNDRNGYGLFATRDYAAGEKVTEYYGARMPVRDGTRGDYMALLGKDVMINGLYGFKLGKEQGRWINESDSSRTIVNVELGRIVRTTQAVSRGEQFFADYGDEYDRDY